MAGWDVFSWFIANLHTMLGHDKAAAVLGVDPGEKTDCIICRFEAGIATKQDVIDALQAED